MRILTENQKEVNQKCTRFGLPNIVPGYCGHLLAKISHEKLLKQLLRLPQGKNERSRIRVLAGAATA